MTRYHTNKNGNVPFTVEEEAAADAADAAQAKLIAETDYVRKRVAAYPTIGDQLDAIWKGGTDQAAMKVIVDKVKSDNPKPE